jgi:hypothetical protein
MQVSMQVTPHDPSHTRTEIGASPSEEPPLCPGCVPLASASTLALCLACSLDSLLSRSCSLPGLCSLALYSPELSLSLSFYHAVIV